VYQCTGTMLVVGLGVPPAGVAPSHARTGEPLDPHTGLTQEASNSSSQLSRWVPSKRQPLDTWSLAGNLTARAALDDDPPWLSGSFAGAAERSTALARERNCSNVVYTVYLSGTADARLAEPPDLPQKQCAFVFMYAGSALANESSRSWTVVEVGTTELPWTPDESPRRNSRVPKLLPWLFFPDAKATIYIDAENYLADSDARLRNMAFSVLGDCGASFSAMVHPSRHTQVMEEFDAIRGANKTNEPDKLAEEEAAYRADEEYMHAIGAGLGRMIDGELLVRSNDESAQQLSSAWMRAYMRGADRDQPSFAYAFFKTVMQPCLRDGDSCGLTCGHGRVNLVESAAVAGCGDGKKDLPDGESWWGEAPKWVCSLRYVEFE